MYKFDTYEYEFFDPFLSGPNILSKNRLGIIIVQVTQIRNFSSNHTIDSIGAVTGGRGGGLCFVSLKKSISVQLWDSEMSSVDRSMNCGAFAEITVETENRLAAASCHNLIIAQR